MFKDLCRTLYLFVFLACTSDEYTCRDGTCADMDKVCDGKMDCKDKSDELECQSISFDPTYLKILPPPPLETENNLNDKTPLRISLTVESCCEMRVVQQRVHAKRNCVPGSVVKFPQMASHKRFLRRPRGV